MRGKVVSSVSIGEAEKIKNERITQNGRYGKRIELGGDGSAILSGALSDFGRDQQGNLLLAGNGRNEVGVDNVHDIPRKSDGTGTPERNGKNYQRTQSREIDWEEAHEIVNKLCDLLGVERIYPDKSERSSVKKGGRSAISSAKGAVYATEIRLSLFGVIFSHT